MPRPERTARRRGWPLAASIERAIVDAQQQRQTTVVLVTHNLFQARRLARRVGLPLDGQLAEVADVTTFFDIPRDPRTAAFARGEMVY
jgi:tungstate transport system ATP-binding protein